MTSRQSPILFTTVACLALTGLAFAGPPYVTDDPEPVELNHWEFNNGILGARTNTNGFSGQAPQIDGNYGLFEGVQFHFQPATAYSDPTSGKSHFGWGDTELGLKWRFLDEKEGTSQPQIAFYPLLELPTGSSHDNLGNGTLQAFLPIWFQKSWDEKKWTAYGGGGYGINSGPGNKNWGFVGAVIERKISETLTIGFENYHITAKSAGDPTDTAFNLGATYDFNDTHHLLISAGRSYTNHTGFQFYVAWQITFEHGLFKAGPAAKE